MMRRDMRRNQNDDNFDTKKILYITGAILSILFSVISFVIHSLFFQMSY